MENYFSEKRFDYNLSDTLNLIYCGVREKCYGHKYNKHTLDKYILTFINEGRAEFNIGGKNVVLTENYFYVMHSKSEISYVTEKGVPWSISWLVIEGNQLESILNVLGLTRDKPYLYIRNPHKIKSILSEIYEKINRVDTTSKMECISLVYSFFAALSEEKSNVNSNVHIDKALSFIHEHYCEDINVHDLANNLGLNNNYFSKLFKKSTGVSPTTYLSNLKLEKAKFLLKTTHMKIGEICDTVGYSDQFYFSRIFKKSTGTSPINYRLNE